MPARRDICGQTQKILIEKARRLPSLVQKFKYLFTDFFPPIFDTPFLPVHALSRSSLLLFRRASLTGS